MSIRLPASQRTWRWWPHSSVGVPADRHRRAVLYVHGWNDYFFQTHLADHLTDLGFDFYAIDLRRYGRSLRRGHLHGFITDLDDYGLELAAATEVIAEGHDQLC